MIKLLRYGYGDNFNDLFIDKDIIIKKSKTEYGLYKIQNEIKFYKYLIDNDIRFSIPKIYELNTDMYKMEYLSKHKPLYDVLINKDIEIVHIFLDKIYIELNKLHRIKNNIDINNYKKNLVAETILKIKKRHLEISDIISSVKINKVNGTYILTVNEIYDKIEYYLDNIDSNITEVNLIHGDPNFNNILVDPFDNIYFIDPRGYFGDSELFGLKEYDYAKIKFALTGYDLFDSEQISDIAFNKEEIVFKMDTILQLSEIMDDNLSTFLMITIWLGNSHCFKNNVNKCLKSYYYSLYLATLFFRR